MYGETEQYQEQIAELQNKVYVLSQELQNKKNSEKIQPYTDKYDPFRNPTDYKGFYGDYSKIQPKILEPEYKLPLEPEYNERKNLKKLYAIGGSCLLLQFFLTKILGISADYLIEWIIKINNSNADSKAIYSYMTQTSIIIGINLLIYLFCNLLTAFIGLKNASIRPNNIIRTRGFSFGKAVQYCLIGIFIWTVSIYAETIISDILSKYDINFLAPDYDETGTSPLAKVLNILYGCIIAPITEEILYRGMLLRVFARANQRFAVFATALFFGLGHGNILQFTLAFFTGIFLAHITLKHGSVIPSLIVHSFLNTFAMITSYVSDRSTEIMFIAEMTIIFLSVLGAIMLITFRMNSKLPATTPEQSRRGTAIASGSFFFSVSFVSQLMYMIYMLILNNF